VIRAIDRDGEPDLPATDRNHSRDLTMTDRAADYIAGFLAVSAVAFAGYCLHGLLQVFGMVGHY